VLSVLLTLAVVVTALFVSKPTTLLPPPPKHLGYDFSYTYHAPTHTGGSVTIGQWCPQVNLAPGLLGVASGAACQSTYLGLWHGCLVQLPDLSLRFAGWKADQCTTVPTFGNGESTDAMTTTFHIDPKAVWSDGAPLKSEDFLFAGQLLADPTICGCVPPWKSLIAVDPGIVQIEWPSPYGDYLAALASLSPLPLHVYATGRFAGVYNARTGAYNTALAHQLIQTPAFTTTIPVDNGPFTV
jgi:ABC-type transport system substrate-binding protein